MKVLLLCGYRHPSEGALGLSRQNGVTLIDRQIEALRDLGFEVVVVTAGLQADDQLRHSRHIHKCELVFDTHGSESNLRTNLVAGLKALENRGTLVLPVEVPLAATDVWRQLRAEAGRMGPTDVSVIQMVDDQGAPFHFGFPLYVTAKGTQLILKLKNFTHLQDPRLNYHHVVPTLESALAPEQNPA